MSALYNEIDPKAAAWLRALIAAGHIAPGIVDERSIEDLTPDYLRQFTQVHLFAGIGVWSYALRAAGWADDRPVWTGSFPCQPFSAAGKGDGFADERHLWPSGHWLIDQCKPDVFFGEQVASKDGLGWFDLVQTDMEGSGYACGAIDLCAAGVGAPHIRQRIMWLAERLANADGSNAQQLARQRARPDAAQGGWAPSRAAGHGHTGRLVAVTQPGLAGQRSRHQAESGRDPAGRPVAEAGGLERVADTDGARQLPGSYPRIHSGEGGTRSRHGEPQRPGAVSLMADPAIIGRDGRGTSGSSNEPSEIKRFNGFRPVGEGPSAAGPTNGLWSDADWLHCRDGKWRPVEPGTFPLAHGSAERVGRLRGYGNAIVAPAAQAFVQAYLDATVI